MNVTRIVILALGLVSSAANPRLSCFAVSSSPQSAQEAAGQSAATRRVGAIKAINGSAITLAPDSGPEVTVTVQDATRILRIAPGEKNLKNATPIQLQDLQVGDRILVGGKASDDAKSIAASSIVVMKRSDIEARQEQERRDWQKRGLGGLASAVDPTTGTVTISVTGLGGSKTIAVHTSKETVIRRYAPDSVKFDDAKSSTLQEIQPGDQLRARGNRSADGAELAAEEIVTGSFRNLAGTIDSVDASSGTISVQDLLSRKSVQVKITSDSQLHKLPVELAQRFAVRLKGGAASAAGVGSGLGANPPAGANSPPAPGSGHAPPAVGGMGGGMRSGGAPDFEQMLGRIPAITVSDLHKGDAVMIVATQGTSAGGGTTITLLSGVEPILQAVPNAGQAMMLAPWSLGGGPAGDAGNQ